MTPRRAAALLALCAALAPGDTSRLFYLEQHTGNVRIFELDTGVLLPDPFLTVPAVSQGGEQGLLGLAFHPDYADNGLFFVDRTDASGNTQIERYLGNPFVPLSTDGSIYRVVPEPGTALLLALGLVGLGARRSSKRR